MENKEKRIKEIKDRLNDLFNSLKILETRMNKAREYSAKCEEFDEDSYETEESQEDYNYACYSFWDLEDVTARCLQKLKDLDKNEYLEYKNKRKEKEEYYLEFESSNCGKGSNELNCLLCSLEETCPYIK